MLYLLMEHPRANRYAAVGAYKRDPGTGILLPVEKFPRRFWAPDDLTFERGVTMPTNVLVNGEPADNVVRYLSEAPDNMDGMAVSPYNPVNSVSGKLSRDTEATIADVESMLNGMRRGPSIQPHESPSGAEMVWARYFTFSEGARARLRAEEARISAP